MDERVAGDRLPGRRRRLVRRSSPVHRRPRGQAPRRVRTAHPRHRGAGAAGRGRPVSPVLIPTHVGDLRWPVLSAVRVQPDTGDGPVEFVVVVDCREGTPSRRYAVLTVYGWPDRVVAEQGHYDQAFDRAQQIMLDRARLLPTVRVEVITVRDPDRANEYTVFIDGQRGDVTVTD